MTEPTKGLRLAFTPGMLGLHFVVGTEKYTDESKGPSDMAYINSLIEADELRRAQPPTKHITTPLDLREMAADCESFNNTPPIKAEEYQRLYLRITRYAPRYMNEAAEQLEQLLSQLPEGMKDCTIRFIECEKGHGRLIAKNWLDHGCHWCLIERLTGRPASAAFDPLPDPEADSNLAELLELHDQLAVRDCGAGGEWDQERVAWAIAEIKRNRSALKVAQQAILEFSHAQEKGPSWYTRGEDGMYQQIRLWLSRGLEAVQGALGPYDDKGQYLKEMPPSEPCDSGKLIWRAVEEGLPTEDGFYWCYLRECPPQSYPQQAIRFTRAGRNVCAERDEPDRWWTSWTVSHWRPLPPEPSQS